MSEEKGRWWCSKCAGDYLEAQEHEGCNYSAAWLLNAAISAETVFESCNMDERTNEEILRDALNEANEKIGELRKQLKAQREHERN